MLCWVLSQTEVWWLVSTTTDGMMNGVPYIMYDAGYYHELYEQGDFFEDDDDAFMLIEHISK